MSEQLGAAGVDLGAMDETPSEEVLIEAPTDEEKAENTNEIEAAVPKVDSKDASEKVEVTTKKIESGCEKTKGYNKKSDGK
jgi:hypothetical protein